ncbi:MAG: glycosyltransferase family 2 protein [Bdellovibrionota bacterium]
MTEKILSIVVPAYNEEQHIYKVVDSLIESRPKILQGTHFADIEIVVVNDGSIDGTAKELDKISREYVQVCTHPINMGYGAALKTGFEAAKGQYLAFMDGDGTIDPMNFVEMSQAMEAKNVDMVVGKRFGTKSSGMPKIRKIGNYFFAYLLSFLAGEKVEDTASGIRLFKREVLSRLYPLPDGLHFTPAMSSKALHEKVSLFEVPVSYAERSGSPNSMLLQMGFVF